MAAWVYTDNNVWRSPARNEQVFFSWAERYQGDSKSGHFGAELAFVGYGNDVDYKNNILPVKEWVYERKLPRSPNHFVRVYTGINRYGQSAD